MTYTIGSNIPAAIYADEFRLEHVLSNFVSNAMKFSPSGSAVSIGVVMDTAQQILTFSVTDQGPGITVEEQKSLFKPFAQIRPGELQAGRGSGLGLSICKNILKLHNGTIGCTSKLREGDDWSTGGSTFYFSIEYIQPPPEATDTTPILQSASLSDEGSKGNKLSAPVDATRESDQIIEKKIMNKILICDGKCMNYYKHKL